MTLIALQRSCDDEQAAIGRLAADPVDDGRIDIERLPGRISSVDVFRHQ